MKQLPMTPELIALIKERVSEDIDPTNFAVFEAIALNTKPLPGKRGSIFEKAVVKPVTLAQMVDYINAGNHLPIIVDHELEGAPKGRFFHAALFSDDNSLEELEMRALFYLDETEAELTAKLNAASLDEVSVSFLASALLCSECGFDYFAQGEMENIIDRTCANGHEIGEDGVHVEMVGLNQFIELSLVARGAADKPKILGKSQSKLAPEAAYRLAAKGFKTDSLVCSASLGKEDIMDTTELVTKLSDMTAKEAVATANLSRVTSERDDLQTKLTAAETRANELETQLTAAKEAKPEDYETNKTELGEAKDVLVAQFNALRVANGEDALEGDAIPSKIADLKSGIDDMTGKLTALIPVDGASQAAGKGKEGEAKADLSMFKTKK